MNSLSFLNQLAETATPYNLGAGVPPILLYPPLEISKLLDKFQAESGQNVLSYHRSSGFITKTAHATLEKREARIVNPNHILLTNGVQEAISISLALFRGKTVACLEPFYPGFYDAALSLGLLPRLLSPKELLEEAARLPEESLIYLCPDFDNPSGESLDTVTREALIALCRKNNLYVFEDTTYREFLLRGSQPMSLFSLAPERVIFALSFSKILAPGLRTAFVAVPQLLVSEFTRIKANFSLNNSGITQAIVAAWLEEQGYNLSKHLQKAKERLLKNHEMVDSFFPSTTAVQGGFFRLLNFSKEIGFDDCSRLLKNEKIALCPLSLFQREQLPCHSLRIAIASVETTDLAFALEKIKAWVSGGG